LINFLIKKIEMGFPIHRPRRLRRTRTLRRLVQETRISASELIYPIFVTYGTHKKERIESMPDIYRLSADLVPKEAKEAFDLGISGVILFGIPEKKDSIGSGAWDENGPIPEAIREIKQKVPELLIIADICLCEYTDHGHCGVLIQEKGREAFIDNDQTLELLARQAVCYAKAGVDIVAPSDMMDGRVIAIRKALDEAGFQDIGIMSYAAKYASAFYGPFREAAQSAPKVGNRSSYQMNPPNLREALREVMLDIEEGADIIMIKPALSCLDIIRYIKERVVLPVAAYNVSGEYSMIKAAASQGWINEDSCMMETLLAIKRAGADIIITYYAKQAARRLKSER
jgi:porphobilinogen synthase